MIELRFTAEQMGRLRFEAPEQLLTVCSWVWSVSCRHGGVRQLLAAALPVCLIC